MGVEGADVGVVGCEVGFAETVAWKEAEYGLPKFAEGERTKEEGAGAETGAGFEGSEFVEAEVVSGTTDYKKRSVYERSFGGFL